MKQNIYSVSQVNLHIKEMFRQEYWLRRLYIRGEVSNLTYHKSGHIYFTLKDEKGAINAAMWKSNVQKGLTFRMKEGDEVIALGSVDLYEKTGSYSFYATQILPSGEGNLYKQFEALKKELEEMGMFAPEYKKPIPSYAKTVGIVTAPTGAAIQDIRRIAYSKNPYVKLVLYPALVQGAGAPASIAKGIRTLDQYGVDVMIVGRGGGSMEDLWAFNSEEVARAIFECGTPVISAVGHETDETIADYVADLRVPTPTKGAEAAVCDIQLYLDSLIRYEAALRMRMERSIRDYRQRSRQMMLQLQMHSPQSQINEKRRRIEEQNRTLTMYMERILERYKARLAAVSGSLEALSPIRQMGRGYAYVEDRQGRGINSVQQLQEGDLLKLHLSDGSACVMVQTCETESNNGRETNDA